MESLLTDRLATLSHPNRMEVFRLLMRRCPDALPAGEIAQALDLKASTASVYLSALTQAGLITQKRAGTRLLYAVSLEATRDVVAGLFVDCCRGRADLCPPQMPDFTVKSPAREGAKRNVLFICTGNSARSVIAETILRDMAGDRFTAFSAGTTPRPEIHPRARDLLRAKGHDVSHLRPKDLTGFQGPDAPAFDFVFTVCDRAANEDCPTWPHPPVAGHWGLADPARAPETQAFAQTYDVLHARLTAFTALPFDTLDRATLQRNIDRIGRITAPQEHLP